MVGPGAGPRPAGAPGGRAAGRNRPAAPALSGVVEWATERDGNRGAVLRLEEPAPGFAVLGTFAWADSAYATVSLYFYGEEGAAAAGREADAWQAWMAARFPPDTETQAPAPDS